MPTNIDPLSVTSLYLELYEGKKNQGIATGFLVEEDENYYLITNKHIVNPNDCEIDKLNVYFHGLSLGSWKLKIVRLFEDGGKKWIEHPHNQDYDVVAIPLEGIKQSDIKLYTLDLDLENTDIMPEPAMPVSVIGYPGGIRTGVGFPVWKTGHIASDPGLNFNQKPGFLIDATTRGGMSGSPVILRLRGGYRTQDGNEILAGGKATKFLGVYSGRLQQVGESMELGFVWRPRVIRKILEK